MMYSETELSRIAELLAEKQQKASFSELNRQQLCAALGVSESTIRRLEQDGLPYTPVGKRSKRYDLVECKNWLKEHQQCPLGTIKTAGNMSVSRSAVREFTESCRKVQLRVTPS